MLTTELFIAQFSGKLKTFISKSGKKFVLDNTVPNMVKGQPFVIQIDEAKSAIRIVPIYTPSPQLGMKR